MRRAGRPLTPGSTPLAYFYACLTLVGGVDYGVPVEIKLWDTGRTPLAHMVDVTNGFGLKVLAEHNFLNDNNIAFSPYGLMGIMVALYEGVDGESSYQIQRGMQLPWNRNVMRIGFRDIHRTLKTFYGLPFEGIESWVIVLLSRSVTNKSCQARTLGRNCGIYLRPTSFNGRITSEHFTVNDQQLPFHCDLYITEWIIFTYHTYFVPEEGFLAGLALNNENVTFNDSYKNILRFYGFDLENDQLPKLPQNGAGNQTTPGPTSPASGSETTTTVAMTTGSKPEPTTGPMREETTLNPNAETIDVDVRAPTEATTASPSSAPNAESTTMMPTETEKSTTLVTVTTAQTTTEAFVTTTNSPLTATAAPSTDTPLASEADAIVTTAASTNADTDAETIAQQTSQATSALTEEPTANNEVATTVDIGPSTAESTSVASTMNTMTDVTESMVTMIATSAMTDPPTDGSTTLADMTTSADSSTTINESTLETLQRRKKSIVDFIFTNPPYIDDYFFYRSYHIGPEMPNSGFDDKMFLANGLKSVQVTYMHYETVLEHAYLPHLEASALRLPLDSERYYLLVVLPNRGGSAELGRLLARMARESDLADVYAALRPRRVRAVVPSFVVKGHVTLTTDLQKLSIRDVFEPRQRDFTPMTRQGGVYVRSIEQAVSVAIRKYRPDDHKKNRYVTNRDPVTFSATYPFLYFVMDATIHVALMAGKMVDPLNSRIL